MYGTRSTRPARGIPAPYGNVWYPRSPRIGARTTTVTGHRCRHMDGRGLAVLVGHGRRITTADGDTHETRGSGFPDERWVRRGCRGAPPPDYVSWCPLGFDNRAVFGLSVGYGHGWAGWTVLRGITSASAGITLTGLPWRRVRTSRRRLPLSRSGRRRSPCRRLRWWPSSRGANTRESPRDTRCRGRRHTAHAPASRRKSETSAARVRH